MNRDHNQKNIKSAFDKPQQVSRRQRHYLLGSIAAAALGAACLSVIGTLLLSEPESHETGEEKIGTPLPYGKIETEGDPRINKVIRLMRKTPAGEYLFQYAASQNFQFEWSEGANGEHGSYHGGLIRKSARLESNHALVLTGVHEIHHGWQSRILQGSTYKKDPLTEWQISIVMEAGSCAYTAHYAAEYKDTTGPDLSRDFTGFGSSTARDYVQRPQAQRDFFLHAIVPCFEEIEKYPSYSVRALKAPTALTKLIDVVAEISMNRLIIAEKGGSPYDPEFFRSNINPPSATDKTELFSQFFTPDMQHRSSVPQILALSETPDSFVEWLDRMTLRDTFELSTLHLQQDHFYKMRNIILQQETLLDPGLYRSGTYPPAP